MARLITVLCVIVIATSGCGQKQSNVQQLRSAVRKTLTTKSFSVVATTQSLGQTTGQTKLEHIGSRARILTGTTVRGVFVGKYIYAADDTDPSVFMKCNLRGANGTVRRFDTYAGPLRSAARAKHVSRRGAAFTIDPLKMDPTTRTRARLTLAGGRVKTMTLVQLGTGPNVSPPVTIAFRFDYGTVPAITPPPQDTLEAAPPC